MKKGLVLSEVEGFTLIELIIYMGLMGIFLIILTDLFVATMNIRLSSQSNSSLQQDGRFIISRLNYDIRRAKSITTPALGNISALLQLVINIGGVDKTFSYSQTGDQLMLNDQIDSNQLNSQDIKVSNFTVQRLGNSDTIEDAKDGVQIKFTLTSNVAVGGHSEVKNFQTTVNLR